MEQNDGVFTSEELSYYRRLLQEKKEEINERAANAAMKSAGGSGTLDDDSEQEDSPDLEDAEVTTYLLERDLKLLGEIELAMRKIETGEYGYCEGTGEPISRKRLTLQPWSRFSVQYKTQAERRFRRTVRG